MSMLDAQKYNEANEEQKKEMLDKVKPKATRNIFLIRHGQYFLESKEKNLTPIGKNFDIFSFSLKNFHVIEKARF